MGSLTALFWDGVGLDELLSIPDENPFFRQLSCRVFETLYRASNGSLSVKSTQYVLGFPVGIIKDLAGISLS